MMIDKVSLTTYEIIIFHIKVVPYTIFVYLNVAEIYTV